MIKSLFAYLFVGVLFASVLTFAANRLLVNAARISDLTTGLRTRSGDMRKMAEASSCRIGRATGGLTFGTFVLINPRKLPKLSFTRRCLPDIGTGTLRS